MANGPLGGFMPTPAAPAQPPQVKLDTTADSRGTFNSFLRSMNGATSLNPPSMAPLQGVIADPLAPALSNIDIFNQPVQMMFDGGEAEDFSDFAGFEDSSDPFGGGGQDSFEDSGNDEQIIGTPVDISQEVAALPDVFTGTDTSMFSDDPAVVDRRGVNVGLESRGGFSAGVVPDLRGERFARFKNVPLAMRGIARDFRSKIRGAGDDGLTVSSYFNEFNPSDDNKNRLAEFESLTGKKAGDKLNIDDMQNIMNIQAKYEAGIRNVAPSVQKAILNTVNIDDDRKVEDILGNLDLGKSLLTKPTDFLNIEATPKIGSPAMAGLPAVTSRFNVTKPKSEIEVLRDAVANTIRQTKTPLSDTEKALQQNQLAQQGLNLGPVTFDDDLANFEQDWRDRGERSRGFEDSRVGDDFDTALSIVDQREKNALRDQLLREGEIAQNWRDRDYTLPRNMSLDDLIAATTPGNPLYEATKRGDFSMFKGDPFNPNPLMERNLQDGTTQTATTTTTTLPEDYEEKVGLPFSDKRMRDIERLYNVPEGQRRTGEGDHPNILSGIPTALNFLETVPREQMAIDIALGRPRGLGEMIRGFTATPARNMAEFTNRLQRNIANESGETRDFTSKEIPESQLVRNNRGRVIGIRDSSGRLVTGTDPNAFIDEGGDDPTPIIRPLIPKKPEVDPKPDLPPNIIGGTGGQLGNLQPIVDDTVVASPFAPASSSIQPVTFDTGDLNKLLEMLTGVAARPVVSAKKGGVIGMENGGLIKAVDDFLAAG